jgi:hypothetical protein
MSDDLINFFEDQIELENKIVQSVSDALDNIDNLVVKTALRGISLDSSKHAEMYRSAIALLTSSSAALNEEQLDLQRKVVERHIEMEEAVITEGDWWDAIWGDVPGLWT